MRTLHLTIAYDGTDFFGWQWQPAQRTVQGVLESAFEKIADPTSRAVASGRTDTGVHALGQAVNISIASRLDTATLQRALNARLPDDVVVLSVVEASDTFNAIDDSRGKRYRYVIDDSPWPDLFSRRYAWHVRQRLNVDEMHLAIQSLAGQHDFKGYESSGSQRVTTVRTIREFQVARSEYQNGERVLIEVEADGFLYNMVRNLVGTLVEVGRGKRPPTWPAEVLAAKDRRLAGMTAPPHGLYLLQVYFDE
jgi:tRNA pseudouridine38-40 synthase